MNELARILAVAGRGRSVLATVVDVAGSTYRRPGARMLFPAEGDPLGLISGGCLETDLAERAAAVLDSGESGTVVYDMRSPDDIVWGLGLGCNGEVRVLLERLEEGDPPAWLGFLAACLQQRRPGALATVFEVAEEAAVRIGDRCAVDADGRVVCRPAADALEEVLVRDARAVLEQGRSVVRTYTVGAARVRALVEYVAPVVSLLIFGAGQDAVPLVRLAAELGWRVTVADDRPARTEARRFPGAEAVRLVRYDRLDEAGLEIDRATAVVVMTHHFLHDLELLRFLLPRPARYLGLLGPRRRTEHLLDELATRGIRPTAGELARLHGPVGVDIGSETPEEIALAALAEIRAVFADRPAGFLREATGPLHDRAS